MNWKADKEYTKWAGKYTTTPTYLKHVQKTRTKTFVYNSAALYYQVFVGHICIVLDLWNTPEPL